MSNNPISLPGGYAPAFAIGFADAQSGMLSLVDGARPLPVQTVTPAVAQSLEGTASVNGSVGPFVPAPGRPVYITLAGNWQGTVTVQRSTDVGATRYPLTVGGQAWGIYQANACEPIWEEYENGAALYLSIVMTAGSLRYRFAQ
ncbi:MULTISPECIES: hypothetical protein [unclassified Novosphingobium]|uniref:hypothetical protein n=1 Tax=unclassified Novosphingobium TaxID=2644732 RepID=UPI00135A308D|nr:MULTISPECIES: hypothetical protein [unclassified Novosphingobium]